MSDTSSTSSIINHQSSIILCPGQGAQHAGMGKAWFDASPVAKQTLLAADEALGIKLSELCFTGPEEALGKTDIAQAAIYTVSVASYLGMRERGLLNEPVATAGLSLGEFTALHLAGAFDFLTGLKLVRLRGQAMQDAADASRGSMVALIGADEEQAVTLCSKTLASGSGSGTEKEVLVPANFNCPGQIVISGSATACERSLAVASEMGLRATALKVAGAFHSPLMQPAADRLSAALEQVQWSPLKATVISNVTFAPHDNDPASIKRRLVEQLTSPVRWGQSMTTMLAMHPPSSARYIELAPNKVLSGLMRRIDKAVKVENVSEPLAGQA
jgi:[acyl-carrier-protein] S-malonyltransferase